MQFNAWINLVTRTHGHLGSTLMVANLTSTLWWSPQASPHHNTFSLAAFNHLSCCCCRSEHFCSSCPRSESWIWLDCCVRDSNFLVMTALSLTKLDVSEEGYLLWRADDLSWMAEIWCWWEASSFWRCYLENKKTNKLNILSLDGNI